MANYGQTDDITGTNVTRTALDKGEDLKDFLNTLAGYLPFPYLTEKIVQGSGKQQDVWDTIYDHDGISVSAESLLDFVTIKLSSGETYRQLYDRLLSHARLHLPKPNLTVDGITSGDTGEKMTIALMNFVALDWLNKINPNLVGIVKSEYSRELREDTQLAELVPRIANNVDALLARHDIIGGVEKLWVEDNIAVDRVNRVKHGQQYSTRKKQSFYSNNKSLKKPFCPECHFLARKLKLHINFQHVPADCPRPRSAINLILAGEENLAITDNEPYC